MLQRRRGKKIANFEICQSVRPFKTIKYSTSLEQADKAPEPCLGEREPGSQKSCKGRGKSIQLIAASCSLHPEKASASEESLSGKKIEPK